MRIIALLATLNRPEKLRRVLESLRNTAPHLPVMVATDADDEPARAIARACGAQACVCAETRKGPAYAWNTALAAAPNYDAYVMAADDLIFHAGWLEHTLKALDKRLHGSGLVGFNDLRKDGNKLNATHYLMTHDFILAHNGGVIGIPHYRSCGMDVETCERARKAKKYYWCKDAVVEHDWHGTDANADETYQAARLTWGEDNRLLARRRELGWPDDFPPTLRPAARTVVLMATLNRPERLRLALRSIRETAPSIQVMVSTDADDQMSRAVAAESGYPACICRKSRAGCAHAWNEALAAAPDYDLYVMGADDLIYQPGWYEEGLKALEQIGGSGVVGFNGDRNKDASHYAEVWMETRDFIVEQQGGVFASPHYRTWGVDVEACERAGRIGKYIYAPNAHVTHLWLGYQPNADATYQYEKPYWTSDTRKMENRRAAGWPDDFEAVLKG